MRGSSRETDRIVKSLLTAKAELPQAEVINGDSDSKLSKSYCLM